MSDAQVTRCRCCQAWRVEGARLVLAPRGMAICDRCIQRAADAPRGTTARTGRCRLCAIGTARGELIDIGVQVCDACLEAYIEALRQAGIEVRSEPARATVRQNSRAGGD